MRKCVKILFLSFVILFSMSKAFYAENLGMNIFYGINNVAKSGYQLPLELRIQNKDNNAFDGFVLVNVYESNKSVYVYRSNVYIGAKSDTFVNKNISINNNVNTLNIEVYNNKEELIISERTNIDLSYLDGAMIIGAITSDFYSLRYMDNVSLYNNSLRTKLVEITDENYSHNKNILDQLDVLVISDVDSLKFSESLNFAIENFILNGNPVLVGLGGKNGVYTIPENMYSFFDGPVIEGKYKNLNATVFDLMGGHDLVLEDKFIVKYIKNNNMLFVCSPISFNDLAEERNNIKIFSDIIETSFGQNRLDRIFDESSANTARDFYSINNLLNIVDKMKLPDIFAISIILLLYLAIVTIIIYVYLRNINRRHLYGTFAIIIAIIFTFVMFYFGYGIMKKNTFLTYLSVVDIRDESTREKAFLNFRTSESGSYTFDTSANNKVYPIVKNTNEAILSNNFIDMNTIKTTKILQENNRINVNVENASDFDSNIFVYENSNYLNDVYNIDCNISRFSGEITGRVTNNMDIKIKDANILMYGKILKIGDIDTNHSVSLSRAINYTVPIGNNSMIAEILSSGSSNQNFLKYYLDENIKEYYDYGYLFGFIDNNGTIDINSNDVGDVYGKTLIVRRINPEIKPGVYDICSLAEDVNNINGYFDYANNSINGDVEVINEYSLGKDYLISSVYLENITNYDQGKLDFNVPFYGEVAVYNILTNNFDLIYENTIPYEKLPSYLTKNNTITMRFTPSSMDPLYRKISLPMVRAIGSK